MSHSRTWISLLQAHFGDTLAVKADLLLVLRHFP